MRYPDRCANSGFTIEAESSAASFMQFTKLELILQPFPLSEFNRLNHKSQKSNQK